MQGTFEGQKWNGLCVEIDGLFYFSNFFKKAILTFSLPDIMMGLYDYAYDLFFGIVAGRPLFLLEKPKRWIFITRDLKDLKLIEGLFKMPDNVNTIFVSELKKYVPRPEMIDLFKITLSEAWYDQTNHLQDDSKQLRLQIKELEEKLSYIRELLSSRQIEPADLREIKTEHSN